MLLPRAAPLLLVATAAAQNFVPNALLPDLGQAARTAGACTEDTHCGDHGVCATEEGSCFCDLGFSGKACETASQSGTARGSTDVSFWGNLSLSKKATSAGQGGMMGLLGAPTSASSWFNPFAAGAAFNPFANAAAAAKAASRSVINPFAAPQGAMSFLGAPTMQAAPAAGGLPASPWGWQRR